MAAMSAVEDSDPGATGDMATHEYQPRRRAVNPSALPASRVELLGVGGAPDEPTGLQLVAGQALSGHRHVAIDRMAQVGAERWVRGLVLHQLALRRERQPLEVAPRSQVTRVGEPGPRTSGAEKPVRGQRSPDERHEARPLMLLQGFGIEPFHPKSGLDRSTQYNSGTTRWTRTRGRDDHGVDTTGCSGVPAGRGVAERLQHGARDAGRPQ